MKYKSKSIKILSAVMVALFILGNVQIYGVGLRQAEASGLMDIDDIQTYQKATEAGTSNAGTIYFGSYYQTPVAGYTPTGTYDTPETFNAANWNKDGIQWRVLSNGTGGVLLLADKALYADAFDAARGEWKTSDVRKTLTGDKSGDTSSAKEYRELSESSFAKDAFNEREYGAIKTSDVEMEEGKDPYTGEVWIGAQTTQDKIFLLSKTQANKYKADGLDLKSGVTKFATSVKMYGNEYGAYDSNEDATGYCSWWLGSPGRNDDYAYSVLTDGDVYGNSNVDDDYSAVRAAFNLNPESVLFASAAVGGKTSAACGGGFGVEEYTGAQGWKLTIIDKNISTPTVTTSGLVQNGAFDVNKLAAKALEVSKTSGSKVINIGGEAQTSGAVNYIEYSEESTGENKFVSALLYNNEGTKKENYAKVASVGTSATKKGVFAVKAPSVEASSKLRFFAEEANGAYYTDYASELTALTTVDWASESGAPNVTLSKDYAASGLTVDLFADAKLGFEAGNYDTSVIIDPNQTGIVTADASGTTLTGDVTVNDSATLTMQNQFTLSGNLYANDAAQVVADNLTMAESGVINFNSASTLSERSFKDFTISGTSFNAQDCTISLNTDLNNDKGDTVVIESTNVNGNAKVQVAYDPFYLTAKDNESVQGSHTFLTVTNGTIGITPKETKIDQGGNTLTFTPTVEAGTANDGSKIWRITAITLKKGVSETSQAVSDTANVMNFVWLETVNNVQKRLGELRGGEESDMAWARFQRSNDDYDGARPFNVSGNMYQVGYDFALKNQVSSRGYFGVSFEAFDGTQSYKLGGGDVKSMSLGAYYTKIYDSGHYFDFILRYGRQESDSTSYDSSLLIPVSTKLDYAINSVTLSGEYGYRANLGKSGLYLEPQAEFIYGYLSGAKATSSTNILADIDSTNHFVTRLGLAFGQRVKNFNYYLRGSYYHDFAGTTHVKYGDASYKQDSAQNWWEISLGGGWNISRLSYFYAELTKHFKDISNSLNFNVGFRFTL